MRQKSIWWWWWLSKGAVGENQKGMAKSPRHTHGTPCRCVCPKSKGGTHTHTHGTRGRSSGARQRRAAGAAGRGEFSQSSSVCVWCVQTRIMALQNRAPCAESKGDSRHRSSVIITACATGVAARERAATHTLWHWGKKGARTNTRHTQTTRINIYIALQRGSGKKGGGKRRAFPCVRACRARR